MIAAAVVVAALLAAWAQWQPQRSADASQEALALSATNPGAALAAAQNAVDYDPVSAEALFTLSTIQQHAGQSALARATLVRAVHLQPSNPQTWKALGEYDLQNGRPSGRAERAARDRLPEPRGGRTAVGDPVRPRTARDPERLHRGAAREHGGRDGRQTRDDRALADRRQRRRALACGRQKRDRRALASSSRRAPGSPPARRTTTS